MTQHAPKPVVPSRLQAPEPADCAGSTSGPSLRGASYAVQLSRVTPSPEGGGASAGPRIATLDAIQSAFDAGTVCAGDNTVQRKDGGQAGGAIPEGPAGGANAAVPMDPAGGLPAFTDAMSLVEPMPEVGPDEQPTEEAGAEGAAVQRHSRGAIGSRSNLGGAPQSLGSHAAQRQTARSAPVQMHKGAQPAWVAQFCAWATGEAKTVWDALFASIKPNVLRAPADLTRVAAFWGAVSAFEVAKGQIATLHQGTTFSIPWDETSKRSALAVTHSAMLAIALRYRRMDLSVLFNAAARRAEVSSYGTIKSRYDAMRQ